MPHQLAVTIRAFVQPGLLADLEDVLADIAKRGVPNDTLPFDALLGVHFARLFVLPEAEDAGGETIRPSLVYMAEVDAPVDRHFAELAEAVGGGLDLLFGHCVDYPPTPVMPSLRVTWLREHALTDRSVALAAKLVGRWPSGAPLVLSPERDEPQSAAANDFGYYARDPRGLACPLGAHVRRANPRDTLDPQPGSANSLAVNKRHRILRRSRAYGPVDDSRPDPDVDRGLYFICLNANLTRQFEFVQQTRLNNPNFNGLYDDADPLVGARCSTSFATRPSH